MTCSLDESYAYCRRLARRTAGNFYYSFLPLPRDRFRDMCVLYAFMRVSDDLGDDESLPVERRKEELAAWRTALTQSLDGNPADHPVLPALSELVERRQIPREHLLAVLDGVEMDLAPVSFETFDDLCRYCYRVAGVVGLCCIRVWGYENPCAEERAVDCGTAFQLTNILRDLGEDAAMNRVYLPREDLDRFGYTVDDLTHGRKNPAFIELMKFEVERARRYYTRAEELFGYLDPAGRPILSAMLEIYGGLLRRIEQRNYDVFSRRIKLPAWRKGLIALQTMLRNRAVGCGRLSER